MKDTPVDHVRNFALAGHAGCGKTTLADVMLFKAGKVSRLGSVDHKTSVSDYRAEEQERGHSLFATPLNCRWQQHALFFTDVPGSPDFLGEAAAAMRVCDMALIVLDGANGIEFGAARAWRSAREQNCPRAIFINRLDRENADFDRVLGELQEAYGVTTCIPFTLPVGKEANLQGVVHVLRAENPPAEVAAQVEKYRTALLDTVAEADERLMERYLNGEQLSEAEIAAGLHDAILTGKLVPVFCGSAARDLGVAELMDGIVSLFPHPLQRASVPLQEGELALNADGDGLGLVFKSILDPYIGQMTFMRVYSGRFTATTEFVNLTQNAHERVMGLLMLTGKEQEAVTEAGPGEIVAIAKLKSTKIGDTIGTKPGPQRFRPIEFPKPNVAYACYAVKKGEEEKIASCLQRFQEEDPTVRLDRQSETHELVLWCMGEQHRALLVARIQATVKVEVDLRPPKIPYRETITGLGDARYRHKKQTGGRGQFGEVALRVEPLPTAEFEFENAVVGGNIPKNYIPAIEKGVRDSMTRGPLANCRVINLKATVYDGKYHSVDSSDLAFQIAARGAFRDAMKGAQPILLEPVMKVKISIPDQYLGDVSGDLNTRRGRIVGMGAEEGLQVVRAEVPLAELFNYSSKLRSMTQGRGSFDMEFNQYERVPPNVSKQIEEQAAKEREGEED